MVRHLIYRPWLDALGVPVVTRVYLPISVGWAAARAADGDVDRFRAECGANLSGAFLRPTLWRHQLYGRLYTAARDRWDKDFFAEDPPSARRLLGSERLHMLAAANWLTGRTAFLPWSRSLPAARWTIPSPAEVEPVHGARLADPNRMYPPPPDTKIERSHVLLRGKSRVFWLRFSSPVLGDTTWAKVIEPDSKDPHPTLIVLHGIFAEPGMWPDRGDPFETLVKAGIRVVRATAPWHGRRMLENRYSGEPVLALGPEGLLTLFYAWIAEVAVLLDWARRNGSGTVAIAGISLGSLTAQILAAAAGSWPRHLHPDAMLLVATTGVLTDIIYGGSLATGTGLAEEFEKAGWSSAHLQRWSPLLEPLRPPVMGPQRVLLVIGEEDDLTPLPGGFLLAERWSIPPENIFLRPQGHFSLCLGLAADPAPVHRLHDLIRESDST